MMKIYGDESEMMKGYNLGNCRWNLLRTLWMRVKRQSIEVGASWSGKWSFIQIVSFLFGNPSPCWPWGRVGLVRGFCQRLYWCWLHRRILKNRRMMIRLGFEKLLNYGGLANGLFHSWFGNNNSTYNLNALWSSVRLWFVLGFDGLIINWWFFGLFSLIHTQALRSFFAAIELRKATLNSAGIAEICRGFPKFYESPMFWWNWSKFVNLNAGRHFSNVKFS